MTTRQEHRSREAGPFGAVRRRLLLFIGFATFLFTGAVVVADMLMVPSSIKARIRADVISLDVDASTPGSLIRQTSYDLETLQDIALDVIASDRDAADDPGAFDDLRIDSGDEEGDVIFSLHGEWSDLTVDRMNSLVSKIVDRLNQQRARQRDEALAWIGTTGAAWQARIDQAKAAIVTNPFNPDPVKAGGQRDDERLLRLMIDAANETRSGQQGDDVDLGSDVARLEGVLAELEVGRAVQMEHGTALRDAEAGLARHQEEAALATTDHAILYRPAAVILETASVTSIGPAWYLRSLGWSVIVPALAVISAVIALIVTIAACKLRPGADEATSDSDYLNDPNWPLPPGARREFSI